MKKITVQNLHEYHQWIDAELIPQVLPNTLFLLEGEVGAGKTELVHRVAEHFKIQDVQSPTFAFHHMYSGGKLNLHHVDLYRLKSEEDLDSTGFWDLFEKTDDVIFVEWSNLVNDEAWPWGWKMARVRIEKRADLGDSARDVSWG